MNARGARVVDLVTCGLVHSCIRRTIEIVEAELAILLHATVPEADRQRGTGNVDLIDALIARVRLLLDEVSPDAWLAEGKGERTPITGIEPPCAASCSAQLWLWTASTSSSVSSVAPMEYSMLLSWT